MNNPHEILECCQKLAHTSSNELRLEALSFINRLEITEFGETLEAVFEALIISFHFLSPLSIRLSFFLLFNLFAMHEELLP